MKKYRSSTDIAFNVTIKGMRKHVSFDSVTGGGSTFMTDDEVLQEAMEKSNLFGKLFVLESETKSKEKPKPEEDLEGDENPGGEDGDGELKPENGDGGVNDGAASGDGLTEVPEITNCADAKAFLVGKDAPKDAVKNKEVMKAYAATIGFVFPNLK